MSSDASSRPTPETTLRDAAHAARHLARAGTGILVVFTGLALLLGWQLRQSTLAGLVARDAEVFTSVLQLHLAPVESELVLASEETRENLLLEPLLEVTSLRGVVGMRLYDPEGTLTRAVPETFVGQPYTPAELAAPRTASAPGVDYLPRSAAKTWFPTTANHPPGAGTTPQLRLRVPLALPVTGEHLGTAEFLLDASHIAGQRAELDRRLLTQTGVLIAAVLVLATAVHRWAWRRLRAQAETLAAEQRRLIRTNQQLALSVKSSAIGAVTAHLLHDLKSSVAGLESFCASGAADPATLQTEDWQSARLGVRRIRHLSAEIADILRSLETGEGVDLDAIEIIGALGRRHRAAAEARQIALITGGAGDALVDGSQSQLVLLILSNLLHNAIEATPPGGRVELRVERRTTGTAWSVIDSGPGIPPEQQARLFTPMRSAKPDGTGIGLAISAQIASHLHATLRLASTGPTGTVFQLELPATPSPLPPT